MNKPILVRCDNCGMITTVEFKVKDHPNTLKETYFTCDICNHHFTCFVTDKKVRALQQQTKWLREQGKQEELLKLQGKINKRMERLKRRVIMAYGS